MVLALYLMLKVVKKIQRVRSFYVQLHVILDVMKY